MVQSFGPGRLRFEVRESTIRMATAVAQAGDLEVTRKLAGGATATT